MRIVTSLLCLAVLSACAMHEPLAHVAIEQNALVARSTDEMMLLNIARAMEREPMHFTSISALHGNVTLSAGASLTGALGATSIERAPVAGGGTADTLSIPGNGWTPAVSGTVSTNPSFDLAVNDSQEFYQGFLAPIEPSIVAHYLDDGWPSELITYLLVRRFDFVASHTVLARDLHPLADDTAEADRRQRRKGEPAYAPAIVEQGTVVGSLINDADVTNARRFQLLSNFVHCFHLAATTITEADHVLGSLDQLKTVSNFEKLDGKTFDLVASGNAPLQGPVLVRKGGTTASLKLVDIINEGRRTQREPKVTDSACNTFSAPSVGGFSFRFDQPEQEAPDIKADADRLIGANGTFTISRVVNGEKKTIGVPVDVQISLRSPEALIYFLGEYSRYESLARFETDVGKPIPPACRKGDELRPVWPIFVMHKATTPVKAVLSVRLDGSTFAIPDTARECIGRTMQVLGLVEQLVDLHKSSKDKIGTQSVRLIQ